MQNAKDTFYEMLRGRLTALNPGRTIVLRGVVRPGVLVEENELLAEAVLTDCFRLQWSEGAVDAAGILPLVTLRCTIAYETAGSAANAGMDRGRLLAAMDAELQAAVNAAPQSAPKSNYSGLASGAPAMAMSSRVWWGTIAFGKAESSRTKSKNDRIARTATVDVMSYQEAGEL